MTEWVYHVESCVFGVLSVICQQIQKGVFVGFFTGKARSSCLAECWCTSLLFDICHVALRINCQVEGVLGGQTHCFLAYLGITAAWKADELAENHYFGFVVWRSVRKGGYRPSQADKKVIR